MIRCIAVVCALLAISLSPVGADVPELLSYQGVLTDGAGVALPDGSYNVAFRLYDVEAGGSPLWQEAHLLAVTKGIFNAMLGWTQPLGALPFDRAYYLGITVEGGAELAPRTLITDAAYAMNARSVRGSAATANYVPATGSVGIGTTAPDHTLSVTASTGQVPLYVRSGDPTYASIYVDALQPNSDPGYGYCRESLLRAHTYVDDSNTWKLRVGGVEGISVRENGDVGIGIGPLDRLHVNGGLIIGNTAGAVPGTLRWTGSDFEGYDGSTWKSLTATGGGGSLPSGAAGQTLRHDGATWVATSALHNDGSQIGIGTTSPLSRLHLEGAAFNEEILVNKTDVEGRAVLRLKSPGGAYDHFVVAKHGSSSAVSIDGISLANMSLLDAGINAGPMMLRVATASPMHFLTSNLERMRLLANGNLGVNTKSPEAKLHVRGDQWDVANTEGDFKIGSTDYRLKFGVETTGPAAGTARMFAAGGAQKLVLGAGGSEVLSIDGAGNTSIGGATSNGKLRLFRTGVDSALVHAYTTGNGGSLWVYDEQHAFAGSLQADPSGEGGYFSVYRNALSGSAFYVDGNYNGTNEPRVVVLGSLRYAQFRMDQTDNGSVLLPTNAIGASEILDEPGAASYTEGTSAVSISPLVVTVIGSRSITTPAAGYVLVVATAQALVDHINGQTSSCNFGVSTSSTVLPGNQDVALGLAPYMPDGLYSLPITLHGLFEVASSGSYTYYFLGDQVAGSYSCHDVQLTLLYIPTSYGTVMPTIAGTAADAEERGSRPGLTAAELDSERSRSIADNAARVDRELAEMRARLEELERESRNEK